MQRNPARADIFDQFIARHTIRQHAASMALPPRPLR
jgi:hypothetical protein